MNTVRALVVAAGLALAACGGGGPTVQAGEVVDREYDDADTWFQCMPIGSPDKPGYNSCGIQVPHRDPERWRLRLRCEGHESWKTVDVATYDSTAVGDFYPHDAFECEVED